MRWFWLVALLACKPAASVPGAPARLVVSFGSICCGTDSAAETRLRAVPLPSGVTLQHASWGREGESDECFDLSPLSTSERAAFVKRVSAAIAGGENVSVVEDGACHKER